MPKARLKVQNIKDLYLQRTMVENLFVSEFMPSAPGEYVKVYLFGLMYAQNDMELDVRKLARVFQLEEVEIIQAWEYWARRGLMNFSFLPDEQEYEVEYLSQIDALYGKTTERASEVETSVVETAEASDNPITKMINIEIQAIFKKYEDLTGRMLSSEDAKRMGMSIKTYNILPDVMSYAVDYCVSEDRPSISNILRTAESWVKEGCKNLADVKEYLDKHSKRNSYYNYVFKEMGWKRLPSPADREMMDRWFDELGYTLKDVLNACRMTAGLRDPSLRYVDKVLENKKLEAGGINTRTVRPAGSYQEKSAEVDKPRAMVSKKVLKEYYDYIRMESDKEQDAHIDEVCRNVMEMRGVFDLENELNNELLTLGFSPEGRSRRKLIREQRQTLEEDKKRLLRDNGYSEDYLDKKYRCSVCKDTGFTDDGRVCACSVARAEEAYKWNQNRNQ